MPFTPAHPAAILPLIRLGLPASALAIGSMAPDFPYFLVPGQFPQFGHTLPGVGYFCIPAGLIALAVFHAFLCAPAQALLPDSWRAALASVPAFRIARLSDLVRVLAALAVGAITHILWDSVTHAEGAAVLRWSVLSTPVLGRIALYKLLQHGSTLVGFALIALAVVHWYRRTIPATPPPPGYSPAEQRRFLLVAAVGIPLAGVAFGSWQSEGSLSRFVAQAAVGATLALLAGWIALAVRHARRGHS